jgi:uncharacterized protein with HEPN domain
MPPEIAKFLRDIEQACVVLEEYVKDKSFDDYLITRMLRDAVEREFILIGEALLQAHKIDSSLAQSVSELRRIVGFRNVLVHGYASIDHQTVWGVLLKDVPVLKQQIQGLLATVTPP